MAADGHVTDGYVNYYRSRAAGGCGMIVLEPMNMHRNQTDPRRVKVYNPETHDGIKRLAEAVEAFDCRLLGQIFDHGRGRHEIGKLRNAIGPSALPDDLSWTVPHVLSVQEIRDVLDQIIASTIVLRDAGISGVELSCGHGHLFHQFISPQANHREDDYGGPVENRVRLLAELIDGIRSACGEGFVIGLKLPGEDGVPGGVDLEESKRIAAALAAHGGFDYWTFAWGAHANTLNWHLPDMYGANRVPYLGKIKEIRSVAPEIATGALGLITDPNEAETAIATGVGEMAMIGRPLITDPSWPIKAEQGREEQIRYCVSGNSCWQLIIETNRIGCDNNPRVGEEDEADWWPAPAEVPKRVVVVGAGVAGMEAAWVAAARGHQVTIFGKSDAVGGKTRLHTELPGGENLSSVYDYQELSGKRAGLDMRLGHEADADDILALKPDHVILACGGSMIWPDCFPEEFREEGLIPDARALAADLLRYAEKQPGTAFLYDADHTVMTYAIADMLAERFDRVVIATPRERVAADCALVQRQGIYRRLDEFGIEVLPHCKPVPDSPLEDGILHCINIHSGKITEIGDLAAITYATPRAPNDALKAPLEAAGIPLSIIGDCFMPGAVHNAISEGYRAAMRL